jgi:hypothetical protein
MTNTQNAVETVAAQAVSVANAVGECVLTSPALAFAVLLWTGVCVWYARRS